MIHIEATIRYKGYDPRELSHGSNKRVCCVCDGCGRVRWGEFRRYRDLCLKCSRKTKEYRRKQSELHKGKIPSEKTIEKLRERKGGRNNPNYGISPSDETRELMRIAKKCKYDGENNPNWKGGISSWRNGFYSSQPYKNWRKAVFERDDYTCQECGDDKGGNLNAHHIIPVRDNKNNLLLIDINNGITLCEECHDKVNGKEYEFVERFKALIRGK